MNTQIPHTCPWWLIHTFDNPLRRWLHNPQKILSGLVHPAETALDVGCGMGYFTLALADLVGKNGKVIAADLQPEMLNGLRKRAVRASLLERIEIINSAPDKIGLNTPVDFALAFWMLHEVRSPEFFLHEIYNSLKHGGRFLIVEPLLHVPAPVFDRSLLLAQSQGFVFGSYPKVNFSRAVLLTKR